MHRLAVLLLAVAVAPAVALGQADPAARGSSATPRFAQQARAGAAQQVTVSSQSPFGPSCGDRNGALYINSEVEPHLAVDPRDGNQLVGAWQQDRYNNGGSRGQVSGVSLDGGNNWQRTPMAASACVGAPYERATDPWVTFAPDGTIYEIGLGISGTLNTSTSVSAVLVFRSTDGGITWGDPTTIARSTGALFDDKDTITADPNDPRYVYAVWDRLHGNTGSATVFARTTDGGATWEPSREVYQPAAGETIANLIRVLPDGTLVDMFMQLGATPTIYVIRSTDRGITWSDPIFVAAAAATGTTDPQTGTGVRDAAIIPQMAVGPDGVLHVVWQDSRFTQVRDGIAYSRSTDGGFTWSTPVRVNADPSVAAFIPQVHVRADGVVGVTYFDFRSNTADAATLLTDYWIARSSDGVNWSDTRVSPAFDLARAPNAGGLFLGDYMALASSGTTFVSMYVKTTGDLNNRNDVYVARIPQSSATSGKEAPATYRAQALPAAQPDEAFWQRVEDNAGRALRARYLKVQRYTASIPGR